jgi:glycosyltransferase involved in cell wall biosynthesis
MFSILMSIYKGDSPDYFEEAYQSLLTESHFISQVVLVCDGPIGIELERKVNQFYSQARGNRIIFDCVRLERNLGLGTALAIGQYHCKHDYIVRMDADDISLPGRFLELKKVIDAHSEVDVVGAQIEEFYDVPGDANRKRLVPLTHSEIYKYSKFRNPMNHVTVCIKKDSLIKASGYEDMLWHEDYYLWVKMLQKGCNFKNLASIHVAVRVKDIGVRRSGLRYFKAEMSFLRAKYSRTHFSHFNRFLYIIIRVFFRFSPKSFTGFFYKYLRK